MAISSNILTQGIGYAEHGIYVTNSCTNVNSQLGEYGGFISDFSVSKVFNDSIVSDQRLMKTDVVNKLEEDLQFFEAGVKIGNIYKTDHSVGLQVFDALGTTLENSLGIDATHIYTEGDISSAKIGGMLSLKSPDGTSWDLTINDSGVVTVV